MTNEEFFRPIESMTDLVEYFLCDDNDSPGCSYVRGWVSHLNGAGINAEQAAVLLFWLREDREIYRLILQVASGRDMPPTIAVILLINKLTTAYQNNAKGKSGE